MSTQRPPDLGVTTVLLEIAERHYRRWRQTPWWRPVARRHALLDLGAALDRFYDHEDGRVDVVTRIRSYTNTPANQGQRDTPPHREGGRHAPSATLRQPGVGSEGRDAATSDRYRRTMILDVNVVPDPQEMADADLVMCYHAEDALVLKDRYGEIRWLTPIEAEELVARSDLVVHPWHA